MKAFLFITIFFLSFPMVYLGYQNIVASGALNKTQFETTGSNGSNFELVVIEVSKFSFIEDNGNDTFIIATKDGQEVILPTKAGGGNLRNLFADWTRTGGGDGSKESLSSPQGCNFVNFYVAINTKSNKLADNIERAYCTVKREPNYIFIP